MSTLLFDINKQSGTETGEVCNPALNLPTFTLDVEEGRESKPVYGPGASQADEAPVDAPIQHTIPSAYRQMDAAELYRRIENARATLGEKLVILGHHYQREDIVQHADFLGDSFKLSQQAAARPDAEYIVFCGVHFMAESADILSGPTQKVVLPNLSAGCSMADLANLDDVQTCWEELDEVLAGENGDDRQAVLPVTYMNSAANLKAFCGENNGIVCTSSNASAVLKWAFQRGRRVLFFPDQHLGRNTAVKLGIPLSEMILWDPAKPLGGNTPEKIKQAKIILWKGWCSVHMRFTVEQIEKARAENPGTLVVVHPECTMEVVNASDEDGSTEYIIQAVEKAPAGTTIAIGTEINLVRRLAKNYPDKTIYCLDPVVCPCSTMYRIHPAYLAWVLEGLVEGKVYNQITVAEEVKHWARIALERMLTIK